MEKGTLNETLSFSFLKKTILLLCLSVCFGGLASIVYSQQAPIIKLPNCYRPKPSERHDCFVRLFEANKKRVEERKKRPRHKPPNDSVQKINAEHLANEERRKQELELIRQRVEAAREKNITGKGAKYKITYGRVLEPSE